MENQHVFDTYYYKLPPKDHQRDNQHCRDDLSRMGNGIPINNPGYGQQVGVIFSLNIIYFTILEVNRRGIPRTIKKSYKRI